MDSAKQAQKWKKKKKKKKFMEVKKLRDHRPELEAGKNKYTEFAK